MLYRTLTLDQLMQLDPPALAYALRLFEQELNGTIALLKGEQDAVQDEQLIDDLSSLLTLRKVFRLRLAELKELAGQAQPAQASTLPAAA